MLTNPIDHLALIGRQNKNLLHPLRTYLTIALSGASVYLDWVESKTLVMKTKRGFAHFLTVQTPLATYSNDLTKTNLANILVSG